MSGMVDVLFYILCGGCLVFRMSGVFNVLFDIQCDGCLVWWMSGVVDVWCGGCLVWSMSYFICVVDVSVVEGCVMEVVQSETLVAKFKCEHRKRSIYFVPGRHGPPEQGED